ncbi:MAG: Mrp/NBP35 family ATP-binding protein [Bacillota bacterium]|nr:Mrp/NBP35 family ATP-binding protein [Bacillota bacterium]
MPTRESVWEALSSVYDPELGRPITDLDMVQDIHIEGSTVRVEILLTVEGCPLSHRIEKDVEKALQEKADVREVRVELGFMTEKQREALVEKIRGPQPKPRSPIMDPDSPTRVVAVASGKGGVGKSTVTVNLAVALAQEGYRVGLLDADIYGFSIPTMLDLEGPPRVFQKAIVPMEAYGVQVMSMGFLTGPRQAVVWRGPMISGAVEQFLRDVLWGDLDYLLVDLPPGTGDVALTLATKLRRAQMLLVTTPEAASTNVAQRAGLFAEKTELRLLGVVENMSYFRCPHCGEVSHIFGRGGGKMMAQHLGTQVLAEIPLEVQVREGSDSGRPVVVADPESEAARIFRHLAHQVAALTGAAPSELRA